MMNRRVLLQLLGAGALASALPFGGARASDSGDSSAGSGDSSAGSGDSSGDSAASSGQSADSSGDSADSSEASANSWANSGDSSAGSSEGSIDADASAASIAMVSVLGITTTTVAAVILVILVASGGRRRGGERQRRSDTPSAALLESGMLGARRDLALQLSLLASSPAQLDRLRLDAARGRGGALDGLARCFGLPPGEVARAVNQRWRPIERGEDAVALALGLLADLGPELRVDPDFSGEMLWGLREELLRDTPRQATRQRVASWMGVRPQTLDRVGLELLGPVGSREQLHAEAIERSDALADALSLAEPDRVSRRYSYLVGQAGALERALSLGLPMVGVPA